MNVNIFLVRGEDVAIMCGHWKCFILTHNMDIKDSGWYMKVSSITSLPLKGIVDGVDEMTFFNGFEDVE